MRMSSYCKIQLLGLGNPILDISASVDHAFLAKYNLELNGTQHVANESIFRELELGEFDIEYIAGGSVDNACRVAQQMLKDKAGIVGYFGCIGKDENGEIIFPIIIS